MQLQTSWNNPFVAIEENRKESQYKKFTAMSELWGTTFNLNLVANEQDNWIQIYNHQEKTLKEAIAKASSRHSRKD